MDNPADPAAVRVPVSHAVADGVRRGLDPRHVTTERIGSWIFAAFVGSGLLIGLAVTWVAGWLPLGWRLAASGGDVAVVGGLCWLAQFYPPIDHRRRSYVVSPAGVEIRKGVLWRSVVNVARSRVQHTDVVQGPLQRRFGLATLIIHTAGTQNAAIDLSGLAYETALAIRDFLVHDEDGDERDGTGARDGAGPGEHLVPAERAPAAAEDPAR